MFCRLIYPVGNAHAPYYHLCPAPLCTIFPHYLINAKIFGKKLLNTNCVFWFSLQFLTETFLILKRIQRDIIKNVYRPSRKVPALFLSDINPLNAELNPTCHLLALLGAHHIFHVSGIRVNGTLIFYIDFRKIFKKSNFTKIRPVGVKLFHKDGQTDMTKLFFMVPFIMYQFL